MAFHTDVQAVFRNHMYFCGRYELFSGPPAHRSATSVVIYAQDHDFSQEYEDMFKIHAQRNNNKLNLALFKQCVRSLSLIGATDGSDAILEQAFEVSKGGSSELSLNDVLRYCSTNFGTTIKVAIKFMRNKVCGILLSFSSIPIESFQ